MATETKTLSIDGQEVAFRCSGATYILYRSKFKKDLFKEFTTWGTDEDGELPEGGLEMLIRAGYIMNKQANPEEQRDFEEWCDQFSFLGLAQDIPQVAELLIEDRRQTAEAKKKKLELSEK